MNEHDGCYLMLQTGIYTLPCSLLFNVRKDLHYNYFLLSAVETANATQIKHNGTLPHTHEQS